MHGKHFLAQQPFCLFWCSEHRVGQGQGLIWMHREAINTQQSWVKGPPTPTCLLRSWTFSVLQSTYFRVLVILPLTSWGALSCRHKAEGCEPGGQFKGSRNQFWDTFYIKILKSGPLAWPHCISSQMKVAFWQDIVATCMAPKLWGQGWLGF